MEKEAPAFLDIVADDNFRMKLFVMKCIHYDILTRSRGKTLDQAVISFGDDFLGEGIDKVVNVLNAKANQKLYLALDKRLETAMAAGTLAGAPIMSGYEIENAVDKIDKGEKKAKERGKITTRSASGKAGRLAVDGKIIADNSKITEVTGKGLDSGDYEDEAPEII